MYVIEQINNRNSLEMEAS